MRIKRRGREKSHGRRQNVLRDAEGVRHRYVPHMPIIFHANIFHPRVLFGR